MHKLIEKISLLKTKQHGTKRPVVSWCDSGQLTLQINVGFFHSAGMPGWKPTRCSPTHQTTEASPALTAGRESEELVFITCAAAFPVVLSSQTERGGRQLGSQMLNCVACLLLRLQMSSSVKKAGLSFRGTATCTSLTERRGWRQSSAAAT